MHPIHILLSLAFSLVVATESTLNQCGRDGSLSSNDNFSIVVRRYADTHTFTLPSNCSAEHLIQLSREYFQDSSITKLVSLNGLNASSLIQHDNILIALDSEERFFWPSNSEKCTVIAENHEIGIKSLASVPKVFYLENLISSDEADHFIQVAKNSLKASFVGNHHQLDHVEDVRRSRQAWIGPRQNNDDNVFRIVRQRICNLTRMPIDLAESFQVVQYPQGGYFHGHHDYIEGNQEQDNPYYKEGGNRLLTVLMYLNDVEENGETAFPMTNSEYDPESAEADVCNPSFDCLKVHPKKGDAVMFYNMMERGHMKGEVDPATFHAGCPVTEEKWIANLWIRNKRVNGKLFNHVF